MVAPIHCPGHAPSGPRISLAFPRVVMTAANQEATGGANADADAPPAEYLRYFALPAIKRRLAQQERRLEKEEQRRQRLARLSHDFFGDWDDHCTDVLCVSSDALPLFPCDVEGGMDAAISDYARQVKDAVWAPMRQELERLSAQFLRSLSGSGESSAGSIIGDAIAYQRHFSRFLSLRDVPPDGPSALRAAQSQHDNLLSTLHQCVVTPPSKDDGQGEPLPTMISQFTSCPATRSNIVGDLQQLLAFLSSRKQELSCVSSSSSTRNSKGRDVIDAIELQWVQYAMTQRPGGLHRSIPSASSLAQLTLEDVATFHAAAQTALNRILGEGTRARKLRCLADTVGVSSPEHSAAFQSTCRKAAALAGRMAVYQDQRQTSAAMAKSCAAAVASTMREIEDIERRIIIPSE